MDACAPALNSAIDQPNPPALTNGFKHFKVWCEASCRHPDAAASGTRINDNV